MVINIANYLIKLRVIQTVCEIISGNRIDKIRTTGKAFCHFFSGTVLISGNGNKCNYIVFQIFFFIEFSKSFNKNIYSFISKFVFATVNDKKRIFGLLLICNSLGNFKKFCARQSFFSFILTYFRQKRIVNAIW